MTKEEAIKKLADIIFYVSKMGYITYDTDDELCAVNIAKKHIGELLPSIPSNLEEAAKNYASDYTKNDNGNGGDDWEDDIRITFKAGAEWMAGQGETHDCRVLLNGVSQYKIIQQVVESFEPDEVVTVQIRKKD